MYRFSGWEILVVLAIVLVLFGPERIGKYAREFGKSISALLSGLKDKDENPSDDTHKPDNGSSEN